MLCPTMVLVSVRVHEVGRCLVLRFACAAPKITILLARALLHTCGNAQNTEQYLPYVDHYQDTSQRRGSLMFNKHNCVSVCYISTGE